MAYDLTVIGAVAKILAVVRRETKNVPLASRPDLMSTLVASIPSVINSLQFPAPPAPKPPAKQE